MASNHVDYGVVIDDALSDPKTKLSTLRMLQKRGQKSLATLGDLKSSLKRLDREIKARSKK
jgi:hypothetical protein